MDDWFFRRESHQIRELLASSVLEDIPLNGTTRLSFESVLSIFYPTFVMSIVED